MPLVVALVPHSWKNMHVFIRISSLYLAAVFYVFIFTLNISIYILLVGRLCCKILSHNQWIISILLAGKVAHQVYRVIYIVHINGGICITAYQCGKITAVTQQHKSKTPQCQF